MTSNCYNYRTEIPTFNNIIIYYFHAQIGTFDNNNYPAHTLHGIIVCICIGMLGHTGETE